MLKSVVVDLAVLWFSIAIGVYALVAWIPVLVLIAAIGAVTGVVWLCMDMYHAIKELSK